MLMMLLISDYAYYSKWSQVIVHFVRQSGSYITSCFIPTAMLGLLAYSTFFIHIDDFNDRCLWWWYSWCFDHPPLHAHRSPWNDLRHSDIIRFMGSLTALLVLASMMPVFTGDLPKASYTKVFHQFDDDFAMVFLWLWWWAWYGNFFMGIYSSYEYFL